MTDTEEEGLTYAAAGVDRAASEAATSTIARVLGDFDTAQYAGLLDLGDRYLALATDGVGTKLLVAHAMGRYDTIGIDCMAMNVNDLVAIGIEPLAFVDYLAMDEADESLSEALAKGLVRAAECAEVAILGGELAILPEIVTGFDLAGACVGMAPKDQLFDGGAQPGNLLVGFPSSGIHSNGLTLARTAVTSEFEYTDPFPTEAEQTIGDVLLEPTRIYTDLLEPLRAAEVNAVAHITGGGWRNLGRLGTHAYVVDDPLPAQPVFDLIEDTGGISPTEMHRTFNMGTGMVAAVDVSGADILLDRTDGQIIGHVTDGSGVTIRGLDLDTTGI